MTEAVSRPNGAVEQSLLWRRQLGGLTAVFAVVLALEIWPQLTEVFAPLNGLTALVTALVLRGTGLAVELYGAELVHPGGFGVEVDYACTALIPIAVITVSLSVMPQAARTRVIGIALGAALLLAVNLLRLVTLFHLGVHYPSAFDVAHDIFGQAAIVASTAGFLVVWLHWIAGQSGAQRPGSRRTETGIRSVAW